MPDAGELVARLDGIVREQSEIIDELYLLLMQHVAADEFCGTATAGKMADAAAKAAGIRESLEGGA